MNVYDFTTYNFVLTGHQKNKKVKTVVNKLNTIDNQFRFFKMELIAGEPDYVVEHVSHSKSKSLHCLTQTQHESGCRFTFDFTQVYWNSRLHTEHDRLVQLFKPDDVIADGFAGVGPFAVPAAKKGCAVLGNDLNPNSAKYLLKNVQDNRVIIPVIRNDTTETDHVLQVTDLVRVSCEDGRDFIRASVSRVYDVPFPAYNGPQLSKM